MKKKIPYQFSLGIELECYAHQSLFNTESGYHHQLAKLLSSTGVAVTGGTDSSIRDYPATYCAAELRTPTQRWKPGCENFEKLLCALYPLTESGLFGTNDTCGLHVNVSEASITGGEELDDFHTHILSHFPEHEVLKMFGRVGNRYCRPYTTTKDETIEDIRVIKEGEDPDLKKYHAVANRGRGRIEFRCLGGKNYQIRWPVLKDALKLIRESIVYAYFETKKEHGSS